jgi:hypothetical protein
MYVEVKLFSGLEKETLVVSLSKVHFSTTIVCLHFSIIFHLVPTQHTYIPYILGHIRKRSWNIYPIQTLRSLHTVQGTQTLDTGSDLVVRS